MSERLMLLQCQCTRCFARLSPLAMSCCPKKVANERQENIFFYSLVSFQFTTDLSISFRKLNYTLLPPRLGILIQINLGRIINLFTFFFPKHLVFLGQTELKKACPSLIEKVFSGEDTCLSAS